MKTLLKGFILVMLIAACNNAKTPEKSTSIILGKSYGPEEIDTSKSMTVKEMLANYEKMEGDAEFTFRAPIEEVCSKAGCWINIDKGDGETFMVRFKDHFTIPVRTKVGTEAYIRGVAYRDTITVEMLRHFAEDAGESAEEINKITEPKFDINFEADGIVLINPSKK
jgi:hypothetical protein